MMMKKVGEGIEKKKIENGFGLVWYGG